MRITEARLKTIIGEEVAEFLNEDRAERRAIRGASRAQMRAVKQKQKAVRRAVKLLKKITMLDSKDQGESERAKKLQAELDEIQKRYPDVFEEVSDTATTEEELASMEQLEDTLQDAAQDGDQDSMDQLVVMGMDLPDSQGGEGGSQFAVATKVIELPNDPYKYKITMEDNDNIQKNGKLHFTIADGPKNKGKSFTLSDTSHPLYTKVKEVHPHLVDFL